MCIFYQLLFALGYTVPLPHVVLNVLNLSTTQYGSIQSSASIGALIIAMLLSTIGSKIDLNKYYIASISWIAILICLIGIMTLPLFSGASTITLTILFMMFNFSFGCTVILGNIPLSIQIQSDTDEAYRGRVQGFIQSASAAMSPIGMGLSGILLDYVSPAFIGIGCGVAMLCYIQWFARYRRRHEK